MKRKIYEFLEKYYIYLSILIAFPTAYCILEIFNTDKSMNTFFCWVVVFNVSMIALLNLKNDYQHSKLLKEFNKLKNKINNN